MSLQVWLPLNGNLNNQGLSNIILNSNNITYDSGKLGNAAVFSSSYIGITNTPITGNITDFSISFWMKTSTPTASMCLYNGRTVVGGAVSLFALNGQFRFDDGSQHTLAYSIPLNTWEHYCVTRNATNIKLYVNGSLILTVNSTSFTCNATNATIGASSVNTVVGRDNLLTGQLNDFRIYDHCLSSREIKEISKGLVLHYPLNQPERSENICIVPTEIPSFGSATGTSQYTVSDFKDNLINCKKLLCTTSGSGGVYFRPLPKDNLTIGQEYTWSIDIKGSKNFSIGIIGHECGGVVSKTVTTEWERYSYTWTATDTTNQAFVLYPGTNLLANEYVLVKNLKIEKGNNNHTQWSPSISDGSWEKIEYDCSGYGNNGTLSSTSLSWSSNSPRYNGCYYFNTNTQYIYTPTIQTTGFTNSYTFSWWGKAPSYSSIMFWGFSNGNRLNYYDGLYCNTGDGGSNPFYSSGTTVITRPSVDTWHHFAFVGNGTNCLLYIDGNLYGTAKTYKSLTGTQIYINGWDSSTSYKTNGYISDFRLYSTVLSSEDIKELYNAPISIDNCGNLLTQGEVIE